MVTLPGNLADNIDSNELGNEVMSLFSCEESQTIKRMKPFNLEEAKAGKPVCTRDGRKARIICFDREYLYEGRDYSIVALVSDSFGESVHYYFSNGKVDFDGQFDDDLMMLSEKKEGWINVYENRIYSTKEEALDSKDPYAYCMTTVKVSWEE